jgi:hypothetical protein
MTATPITHFEPDLVYWGHHTSASFATKCEGDRKQLVAQPFGEYSTYTFPIAAEKATDVQTQRNRSRSNLQAQAFSVLRAMCPQRLYACEI